MKLLHAMKEMVKVRYRLHWDCGAQSGDTIYGKEYQRHPRAHIRKHIAGLPEGAIWTLYKTGPLWMPERPWAMGKMEVGK